MTCMMVGIYLLCGNSYVAMFPQQSTHYAPQQMHTWTPTQKDVDDFRKIRERSAHEIATDLCASIGRRC